MKQSKLKLWLLMFLLGTLLGCTGSKAPVAEAGPRSITLMAAESWISDIDYQLFGDFEAETGVHVNVLTAPSNVYESLLASTFTGGNTTIDLFMYPAGSKLRASGVANIALDLSREPWVEQLEPWSRNSNMVEDRVLGFSTWGSDWEGMLYNRTLFEENGWQVPKTWQEFLALCDTIQAAGIAPVYASLQNVDHADDWLCSLTYLVSAEHPQYLRDFNENRLTFSEIQALRDSLVQIQTFFRHAPAYYINTGEIDDWAGSYAALKNRRAAMMYAYSAYADELRELGSTDHWGMFPLPLLDNTVGVGTGQGISKYINKYSAHQEESKQLLNFLARKENLERYYAAHPDLINPSFKDIEHTSYEMEAGLDLMRHITDICPDRLDCVLLYWDPDTYLYMQKLITGAMTPEQFLSAMDANLGARFQANLEPDNGEQVP